MAKPQEEKVSFIQRLKQIGTVFSFFAIANRRERAGRRTAT